LIEAKCIRLTPHSSDDNDRSYRPADEIKAMRQHDPIARFRDRLYADGVLDDAKDQEIRVGVVADVNDATSFAEHSPLPDPATLLDHVYASA
jgi:2-oxoisovalerate dehydrogenase E1 component alpha subunit